jgi:hypothetical protein
LLSSLGSGSAPVLARLQSNRCRNRSRVAGHRLGQPRLIPE